MIDSDKQLAIGSAILALIFDIPLTELLAIWFFILFLTIGNMNSFCIVLKIIGLTVIAWLIAVVLAYYIIY